jgi:iron complex transport system ATP-binding protein
MTTKHPYLGTSRLSVGYLQKTGDKLLFQDLDLKLYPGQLVCFMGPNGAGKSSLIRTLAGLQDPISGEVHLSQLEGKSKTQQLSVVLTDKITAPGMTVSELIGFGRYPYLDWNVKLSLADHAAIDAAISRVNIQHLTKIKLYQLSDGQLQMVMIARALAQDTPVILLDEPTAHLDLNNRVEIMNVLRSLARQMNKAILVATHELDLALQSADIIWLTDRSKKIITGIPEDLILNGSFDELFQLKGFDLKTGKLYHEPHKGISIKLSGGEGYLYRWTKNALERSGYYVSDADQQISIHIKNEEAAPQWLIKKTDQQLVVNTIAALIEQI